MRKHFSIQMLWIFYIFFPIYYFLGKIYSSDFYILKDIHLYILTLFVFLKNYNKVINKRFIIFISFIVIFFLISLINFNDPVFYLFGVREFILNPLLYVYLGYCLNIRIKSSFLKLLKYLIFVTVLFAVFYPSLSFSSTYRFVSLWNSEHESAILAGIYLLFSIIQVKKIDIFSLISIVILVLSGSRSILFALFVPIIYIILFRSNSNKKILYIIILSISLIALISFYDLIFIRSFYFNSERRITQYNFALNLILDNGLIGIGIDKYGVVGSNIKYFISGDFFSSTFDSTLLKYYINFGLIIPTLYFAFIYNLKNKKSKNTVFITIFLFSITMGIFTGKLNSFPLSMFFYTYVGNQILEKV